MKQYSQVPGGRKVKGDDLIAIQDIGLFTEEFLAQFGNFIASGCVVTGNAISSGKVMLNGKACIFDGATGITFPYYVKQAVITEDVPYKTGVGTGLGYTTYKVVKATSSESGAFRLDDAQRFADKFLNTNSEINPFANKANASDVFVSQGIKWTADAYCEHVLLLLPMSEDDTAYRDNRIDGTIVLSKRGANQLDSFRITAASVYGSTRAHMDGKCMYSGKLVSCMYNGQKYLALQPGYKYNPYSQAYFYGIIASNWSAYQDNILLDVPYFKRDTSEVLNQEIYDSVEEYTYNLNWRVGAKGVLLTGDAATPAQGEKADTSLQQSVSIPAGADLNTYIKDGLFNCALDATAASLLNCPTPRSFSLLVRKTTASGCTHLLTEHLPNAPVTWVRNKHSATWGEWVKINDGGNADTVDGKHADDFVLKTAQHTNMCAAVVSMVGSLSSESSINSGYVESVWKPAVAEVYNVNYYVNRVYVRFKPQYRSKLIKGAIVASVRSAPLATGLGNDAVLNLDVGSENADFSIDFYRPKDVEAPIADAGFIAYFQS